MKEKISIDPIDARILKMLLKESRTSFTEIAKDCKISVGAARMRYNHLKKAGIINGEIMQVNPYSLGYMCIGNIGIDTSVENKDAVIEFLKKKDPHAQLWEYWGKNNIGLLVAKKNVEDWAEELRGLDSIPHIKMVDPLIWIEPVGMDHSENLEIKSLKQEKTIQQPPTAISKEQAEIDEIDRQIAKILVHGSRTSFRKIAKHLHISTKNVIQRYKKLRKNVLSVSTITLDLKKLGYNALAAIFLKGERSKMEEIGNKILQSPNIIVFYRVIGSYDLRAIVALEDLSSLIRLQKEIRTIHGVEQVDFAITDIFPAWPVNNFASLLNKETN
ncbi:MAG: AsnC family transcriptional regulator [Candidatus Bathyarchaeia archaeon]